MPVDRRMMLMEVPAFAILEGMTGEIEPPE
jgi:hypothetical protein